MSVDVKARPLCAGVSVAATVRLYLDEVDDGVRGTIGALPQVKRRIW